MRPHALLDLRRITLNPAPDCRVISTQTTFHQKLLDVKQR